MTNIELTKANLRVQERGFRDSRNHEGLLTIARDMENDLSRQGLIKDRKFHLTKYKNCFLHHEGLRWLTDKVIEVEKMSNSSKYVLIDSFGDIDSLDELRVEAAKLGNSLIKAGYISHVCNDHEFSVNHRSKVLFFRFHLETNILTAESIAREKKDSASISSGTSTSENSLSHQDSLNRVVDVALFSIVRDLHGDFRILNMIKDRSFHLKIYKKCFLHDDALEWLSRQVSIQYDAAREHTYHNEKGQKDANALPRHLSREQSLEIGSRIGNRMIQQGYIRHVCGDHVFHPKLNQQLFFRFSEKRLEADYKSCRIGSMGERKIDDIQQKYFKSVIKRLFEQC